MSDEAHIESAFRHGDPAAILPWHGMTPDEEMIWKEQGEPEGEENRAWLMELCLVYLFADGRPEAYELVARRVYAVAKCFFPHLLLTRLPDGGTVAVSLEKMGIIFDDPNTESSRAKWSARVKRNRL